MIVNEVFEMNGVRHVRHYSDSGYMIASDDGIEYSVAEDLESLGKEYHETGTLVDEPDNAEEILSIILGEGRT